MELASREPAESSLFARPKSSKVERARRSSMIQRERGEAQSAAWEHDVERSVDGVELDCPRVGLASGPRSLDRIQAGLRTPDCRRQTLTSDAPRRKPCVLVVVALALEVRRVCDVVARSRTSGLQDDRAT